ncbi:MAG: hypothetical protein N2572_07390 [Syntrophales bacterium]|nr:hypothetical protein [Syntrophales bacterium]
MKRVFLFIGTLAFLLSFTTRAIATEFNWMSELNVRAEANLSGFKASLVTRFNLDNQRVEAILQSVDKPADAYMVLKLGEMSKRPPEYVLQQYKVNRGKGWGVLAKSLGIKPGSNEFHALKKGHDLDQGAGGKGKEKGKGKKEKSG